MRKHYYKKCEGTKEVLNFLDDMDNKITVISISQILNTRFYEIWYYENTELPEIKTKKKI